MQSGRTRLPRGRLVPYRLDLPTARPHRFPRRFFCHDSNMKPAPCAASSKGEHSNE